MREIVCDALSNQFNSKPRYVDAYPIQLFVFSRMDCCSAAAKRIEHYAIQWTRRFDNSL